jgi:CubicO group peptidase (beta-lactamase class C family)
LLDYARRTLFEPMGFGPVDWAQGTDGEPFAASGLRLLPQDMLKVGKLVLAGGDWLGRRLVAAEWVTKITIPRVGIDQYRSYGYHWYLGDVVPSGRSQSHHWIGGIGWGGQRLFVLPDLDLVIALNCGNYRKSSTEQNRVSGTIIAAVVLPLVS